MSGLIYMGRILSVTFAMLHVSRLSELTFKIVAKVMLSFSVICYFTALDFILKALSLNFLRSLILSDIRDMELFLKQQFCVA